MQVTRYRYNQGGGGLRNVKHIDNSIHSRPSIPMFSYWCIGMEDEKPFVRETSEGN